MRIILVRHGETEANHKGIYSGWTNYDLTTKGKKQAEKLGKILKNENIDDIFVSPLKRVKDTAQVIANELDKDINIIESLKELGFGIFEGKTNKELQTEYKEDYDKWVNDYINYKIPEGESLQELYDRVDEFLKTLTNTDKTYLVVTHGGVIRTIITILLNMDLEKMWNFKTSPGSLIEIEYNDGFGVLTKLLNTINEKIT